MDAERGYVSLVGGSISITAGNYGIQAHTYIDAESPSLNIVSGQGSVASLASSEESFKGIKAGNSININGGVFNIDSTDDYIHSNGNISIFGGTFIFAPPS